MRPLASEDITERTRSSLTPEERRRRRRETGIILAAALAVVLFAVWEIGSPTGHGGTGNVVSFLLVNLNIVLLLVMAYFVLRNVMKLVMEHRQRVPGSRLRTRLVLAFVTIAMFPATVMLGISYQFVTNNIDDWLNDEVESSLEGAWELAHVYYGTTAAAAVSHARGLARTVGTEQLLGESRRERLRELVAEHQHIYELGTVQVLDRTGRQVLARFNEETPTGVPLFTDRDLFRETSAGAETTKVEPFGEGDIIRGSVPIFAGGNTDADVVGAIVVDYYVEQSARRSTESVLASFREFRKLRLNKQPFKNLYALTLALAALMVVVSATWLGLYLAGGITKPIGDLVQATEQVAEGRWDVHLEERGGDEIGTLVRAFNSMTEEVGRSHEELDRRRSYIENVLGHVDAGVISIDGDSTVGTLNPAAVSLLGLPDVGVLGRPAADVLGEAGYSEIAELLSGLQAGNAPSGKRLNVRRPDEGRTLLVTATSLGRGGESGAEEGPARGWLLFVENVSQIVEAQRMEAWREVARRIAHEIKNPLTPIQLSAQRLGRRLGGKVSESDASVVEECVGTIVGEVDRLKQLVNEFSQFARSSGVTKKAHDLNQLVEETLPLYRQARPDIIMTFEAAEGLAPLMVDREAVKRALVNLIENAVAAVSEDSHGEPRVAVRTRLDDNLSRTVLEVEDNGPGIAPKDRARVFEPYFSTKTDGTGLGLAIVASMAADHRAFLRVRDGVEGGSCFVIEFPARAAGSEI